MSLQHIPNLLVRYRTGSCGTIVLQLVGSSSSSSRILNLNYYFIYFFINVRVLYYIITWLLYTFNSINIILKKKLSRNKEINKHKCIVVNGLHMNDTCLLCGVCGGTYANENRGIHYEQSVLLLPGASNIITTIN